MSEIESAPQPEKEAPVEENIVLKASIPLVEMLMTVPDDLADDLGSATSVSLPGYPTGVNIGQEFHDVRTSMVGRDPTRILSHKDDGQTRKDRSE